MGQNLARHNAKILAQDKPEKTTTGCNCQKSKTCPMPGRCLSEGVIYGAGNGHGDSERQDGNLHGTLRNYLKKTGIMATFQLSSIKMQTTPL